MVTSKKSGEENLTLVSTSTTALHCLVIAAQKREDLKNAKLFKAAVLVNIAADL